MTSDPRIRDPLLDTADVKDLRPTQITVGYREVEAKRRAWRDRGDNADKFLGRHLVPVIRGPKDHLYVTDHHHLVRALYDEGVSEVLVTVTADLSKLDQDAFWVVLDNRDWMHPFDTKGRRRDYEEIPKSVSGLVDDPFRSLAGELRRAGGYSKETTPFSEFLWADFLRRRMKSKLLEKDFARALKHAMRLAKSHHANYLPGWCGPATGD